MAIWALAIHGQECRYTLDKAKVMELRDPRGLSMDYGGGWASTMETTVTIHLYTFSFSDINDGGSSEEFRSHIFVKYLGMD